MDVGDHGVRAVGGVSRTSTKVEAGPISVEETQILEAVEDGTKVTVVVEGTAGGFLRLPDPIVVRMFGRDMQADLERLKDILEAEE